MYVLAVPKKQARRYAGTVHEDAEAHRKNLGGVHLNPDQWGRIKKRFLSERQVDESFSAWVRRRLA